MLTSDVQLGYVLTRDGGQAVQGGHSCPPSRISESLDNTQMLLHHLLQEYLVEMNINFISVNLRWLLQMFVWVTYWQGVGGTGERGTGKLSRAIYSPPPPSISKRMDNQQFSLHWLPEKRPVSQFVLPLDSLPPPRDILPPHWLSSPPGGKLSRPVYLAPRPAHTEKILLCDVYFYLQHFNNYM